jgi:hypothetical protein
MLTDLVQNFACHSIIPIALTGDPVAPTNLRGVTIKEVNRF